MAEQLAMAGVSEAVRNATQRFVQRLPSLFGLAFSDERPFADAATQAWITGAGAPDPTLGIGRHSDALRGELDERLEREGVEAVLRHLQDTQTGTDGPRQRCSATVIAADLLTSRGLAWLAEDLYAHVAGQMQRTAAEHWEPALFAHVRRGVPTAP
jgi:type VI secretion system protein VasJ